MTALQASVALAWLDINKNTASVTINIAAIDASEALIALNIASITALEASGSSEWTASGSTQIYTEKSVGIGTATPDVTKALHVVGDSKFNGKLELKLAPSTAIPSIILNADGAGNSGINANSTTRVGIISNGAIIVNFSSIGSQFYNTAGLLAYKYRGFFDNNSTVTNPLFQFDPNTGFYSAIPDVIGVSNNGIDTARFTADNNFLLGLTSDPDTHRFNMVGDAKIGGDLDIVGKINATGFPEFADEAAAASLTTGDIYKTATGELRIKL